MRPRPTKNEVDPGAPEAAQAAMRTFWKIAEAWKPTLAEQLTLLGVSRTTLYQWKGGKVGLLEAHVLERLSYLFGIYAALQTLLPIPERANEWIRKPTIPSLPRQRALDDINHLPRTRQHPEVCSQLQVVACTSRTRAIEKHRALGFAPL